MQWLKKTSWAAHNRFNGPVISDGDEGNEGTGDDVGRLGRSGFTDSARAELFAYRNRKKKRIKIYLELDAQSKKRLNTESPDQQFISGVEKALKEQGRHTPFRVPVAVHMHFHVGVERMPPQIHQLPKHYLDLLQTPITSRPAAPSDLGPPAAQPGDSETLKKKVRAALVQMRNHYPILNPLYSTVGVTLLYVRPVKAQRIDLDNLARRFVVPIVHDELKPPATSLHAIQHLKSDGIDDKWVIEGLDRLRLAHQITRYQVFRFPESRVIRPREKSPC